MKLSILIFLSFSVTSLCKAELTQYKDPRAAIAIAKKENKLIVFFLADESVPAHEQIWTKLTESISHFETEFIVVKSSNGSAADKAMFAGRFGKNIANLPIAVVSDSAGQAIESHQGDTLAGYDKMLITARIKGGRVTDPLQLAALKDSLKSNDDPTKRSTESFLAPMLADLKKTKALTELREWTRKDGTSFKGILIKAQGENGVFIDEKGDTVVVKFIDLNAESVAFLQTILRVQ